jgi:cyclopropane-fatty-acyl-phospholipid synthase
MNEIILIVLIIIIIILFLHNLIRKYSKNSEKFIVKLLEENTDIRIVNKCNNIINDNMIIVNDKQMFELISHNGELGFAESYIDGYWDTLDLEKILSILIKNKEKLTNAIHNHSLKFILLYISSLVKSKSNTIESSKTNIASHYDIGNNLYEKMLGKYMQYTCAYFHKSNMTLDEAQLAKMELIAKKLNLVKGMTVLDIGCGFGSMAFHLASNYGVIVTGVTLSKEQKKYADKHFSHENVTIELKDYRHVDKKFDRVYSVGMFEHVGRDNYKEYFDKCYDLLEDDGIMLLHTIGTKDQSKWHYNCFINKYIFPEGELPRFIDMIGDYTNQWHLEDFQNFGLSYAKTLRNWKKNIGDWSGLKEYDIKFRRMWDFYLLGCAAAFQNRDIYLWQFVYTKYKSDRIDDCHHIRN